MLPFVGVCVCMFLMIMLEALATAHIDIYVHKEHTSFLNLSIGSRLIYWSRSVSAFICECVLLLVCVILSYSNADCHPHDKRTYTSTVVMNTACSVQIMIMWFTK